MIEKIVEEVTRRYDKDTGKHVLTVLHDEGQYRHLRMSAPDTSEYWFEVATWPGSLAVRGDAGKVLVFTRLPDMFTFFRRMGDTGHRINPWYWSEKTGEGRRGQREFSVSSFRTRLAEAVADASTDESTPPGLAEAWGKHLREHVIDYGDIADEATAWELIESFRHGFDVLATCECGKSFAGRNRGDANEWWVRHAKPLRIPGHCMQIKEGQAFSFRDSWEWDISDWEPEFLWSCLAVEHAIRSYDEHKAATK